MIIWPETAYPYNANINTRMPALKTVFVSGAVYRDGEKFYNSLLRMDPNGRIVDSYHKVRLVPFGEYRPFGDWIKSPGDFTHGAGPKMIDDFVPAICYEIAYSDSLIPRHAGAQAKYILNITSDVWLQNSSGVPQHVDMARRQAIETGLPVVFSNYTGISAIIDNRGGILRSIAYGEVGFMDGPIPPHKITMYRKIGLNRIMLGLAILCGFILIVFRKRRND
jgi:apolipoprotein N-acyltransferase